MGLVVGRLRSFVAATGASLVVAELFWEGYWCPIGPIAAARAWVVRSAQLLAAYARRRRHSIPPNRRASRQQESKHDYFRRRIRCGTGSRLSQPNAQSSTARSQLL